MLLLRCRNAACRGIVQASAGLTGDKTGQFRLTFTRTRWRSPVRPRAAFRSSIFRTCRHRIVPVFAARRPDMAQTRAREHRCHRTAQRDQRGQGQRNQAMSAKTEHAAILPHAVESFQFNESYSPMYSANAPKSSQDPTFLKCKKVHFVRIDKKTVDTSASKYLVQWLTGICWETWAGATASRT